MKKDLSHLDHYRVRHGDFGSPMGSRFGAFMVPNRCSCAEVFHVIADDGTHPTQPGWEHVSVKVAIGSSCDGKMTRIPTWREMDEIKRMFWDDDEIVVQYHVNDERKTNNHSSVLHLWKPVEGAFPMPPKSLV